MWPTYIFPINSTTSAEWNQMSAASRKSKWRHLLSQGWHSTATPYVPSLWPLTSDPPQTQTSVLCLDSSSLIYIRVYLKYKNSLHNYAISLFIYIYIFVIHMRVLCISNTMNYLFTYIYTSTEHVDICRCGYMLSRWPLTSQVWISSRFLSATGEGFFAHCRLLLFLVVFLSLYKEALVVI